MVSISAEQRGLFHCWCREIARHCQANGAQVSEEMVKQLVKANLGNRVQGGIGKLVGTVSMPTEKYKSTPNDLTAADHKHGFISMQELLTAMEAWAATDLNMVLVPDPEFYKAQDKAREAA